MKAVIFATGICHDLTLLGARFPTAMHQVVDRPFIQHVVEYLVDGGISEFDFVLSDMPEKIEQFLGDGTRWGSTFRFHLAQDPTRPYGVLKRMAHSDHNSLFLIGHADRLPQMPIACVDVPALFCFRNAQMVSGTHSLQWTGWGHVQGKDLAGMPDNIDENHLSSLLMSAFLPLKSLVDVNRPLDVRSGAALLDAQRRVMEGTFPGLLLTGTEKESGIRVSRNVRISPTAQLVPPVYVGENCRIGARVHLGPNAVVGRDCVLDRECAIENAVVLPGSYLGEGLEVIEAIVDKNRLVNIRIGADVTIVDHFIMSGMYGRSFSDWLGSGLSRLGAGIALFFLWPLILATACYVKLRYGGPVFVTEDMVRLPASDNEAEWRTFGLRRFRANAKAVADIGSPLRHGFFRVLPALFNAVKGDVRLVGVSPRTRSEIRFLPNDWKSLYLRARSGIITEAYVRYGAFPSEDERFSAEAYSAVAGGLRYELRILKAYAGCVVKALFCKIFYWKEPALATDRVFGTHAEKLNVLKTENTM